MPQSPIREDALIDSIRDGAEFTRIYKLERTKKRADFCGRSLVE